MPTIPPPFEPDSLPKGTLVAGKYEFAEPIGWGRHSVIYEARHRLLDRKAAVKVLAKTDETSEKRFAREAKLTGSISHPNIVEIYEVGRLDDGRPFIAMELLEGESLDDRLRREGPLGLREAAQYGQHILRGLEIAHENQILHRDLRPENVFLAEVRGATVLKILDFGISRRFGDTQDSMLTGPGTIVGERAYLAPEQLSPSEEVDQRTDLYALGVMLYRVLTGRLPFEGKDWKLLLQIKTEDPLPPSAHRADLTRDIDTVILCALSKQKEDRFADAAAMGEALRLTSLFNDYVTMIPPPPPPPGAGE